MSLMDSVTNSDQSNASYYERRIAALQQQNERLRGQTEDLQRNSESLTRQLTAIKETITAAREARRAALNLMEDAVLARRAEQRENAHRRLVEKHLRELNRRKDEFLATLGHELRNPLAAIKGGVQLLQSQKTSQSTRATALEVLASQ